MITKEKALDILDKMDFFQGQRAGRELWNEKSRYVQEMDLQIFREDVSELKAYIADVVPRDEVAKIFEEIESVLFTVARPCLSADGTIKTKHSKDFHIRREDYYTIKEKYIPN